MSEQNKFLRMTKEKAEFNQYWYSAPTIDAAVAEVQAHATRAAFLSTPSIYFSLTDAAIKSASFVFDIDERQFKREKNFVYYDFQHPENIPAELHHTFDYVVIDPPFITRQVWEQYATAAKMLLKEDGKILLSTIQENKEMMAELLGCHPCAFMPSIPHLVYQYYFYTNYPETVLNVKNAEIPE